jgi:1-acyl-sn-glycerol-3-phosphate acyltransferase
MPRSLRVVGRSARTAFACLAAIGDARMAPAATRRARAERLRQLMAEVVAIHDLRIGVQGDLPTGPCVIVANHVGYLDPIVIGSQLACTALAKREVADWPVIGNAGAHLGIVYVDRASTMSRAAAALGALRALRDGVAVLNFPEGTTTDGGRLLPFASGMFGVARIAQVPVIPVALRFGTADLSWTGGQTFLPHYARAAARASISAVLRVGAPISPAQFGTATAMAAAARKAITALLASEDLHEPRECVRVPAPRPDPVLPLAERVLRFA